MARYAASVRAQNAHQKPIADIKDMFKEHITSFHKTNKTRPQRILDYRDGVSEDMDRQVVEFEMTQIMLGSKKEIDINYAPTITVILSLDNVTMFALSLWHKALQIISLIFQWAPSLIPASATQPSSTFIFTRKRIFIAAAIPPITMCFDDDHKLALEDLQSISYNMCHTGCYISTTSIVGPVHYACIAALRAKSLLSSNHQRGD